MTDLETLRTALDAREPGQPYALDLERILVEGHRIRRRRRLFSGAVATGAAAVLAVGGAGLAQLAGSAGTGGTDPADHAEVVVPARPPGPGDASPRPRRPAPAEDPATPLGRVVHTRLIGPSGERLLYVVRIRAAELPKITFGVMLGHRSGKRFVGDVLANEYRGSDRSPGFHAISNAMGTSPRDVALFGYYAGPAARVTTTVGGRAVEAKLTRWSEDEQIALFWFSGQDLPAGTKHGPFRAYAADGTLLPAGDTVVGVG